jgi:hypothetical protein
MVNTNLQHVKENSFKPFLSGCSTTSYPFVIEYLYQRVLAIFTPHLVGAHHSNTTFAFEKGNLTIRR